MHDLDCITSARRHRHTMPTSGKTVSSLGITQFLDTSREELQIALDLRPH